MAKPYSVDLRKRVVARVVAGETVRKVVADFQVSVSAVVKWSQRFRATGSAAPRPQGGDMCSHRVEARRRSAATHPRINRRQQPRTQIHRKSLTHPYWPPCPASILNQMRTPL